jgi:hypothetical protein
MQVITPFDGLRYFSASARHREPSHYEFVTWRTVAEQNIRGYAAKYPPQVENSLVGAIGRWQKASETNCAHWILAAPHS